MPQQTSQQLSNSLNPTATTLQYLPGGSFYDSNDPFGGTYYVKDPSNPLAYNQIDVRGIGSQQYDQKLAAAGFQQGQSIWWSDPRLAQAQAAGARMININGNYQIIQPSTGDQVNLGKQYLLSQGIDLSNVPGQNFADRGSATVNRVSDIGSIKSLLQAPATAAPNVTINNTGPNSLATPAQLAAASAATQQQLAPYQGMNLQTQTDANGNIIGSNAVPLGSSGPATPSQGVDPATGLPLVNPSAAWQQNVTAPTSPSTGTGSGVGGTTSGGTGSGVGGTTSGAATPGAPDLSGLPPEFQQLYTQLDTYLQKLQQSGQVLNPAVQLTPDKIAQFLDQAKAQVDPYFTTQLAAAKDSLLRNFANSSTNLQQSETQAQRDYTNSLRTLGEGAADQGFAQSGIRIRNEGDLATNTQNSIDANRRQLTFGATNAAADFAQNYGGANVPTAPTLGAAPRVLPGTPNFEKSGNSQGLYQLDPSIYSSLIGTQQNAQKTAEDTLASQLGSNYTSGLANSQLRQLTL